MKTCLKVLIIAGFSFAFIASAQTTSGPQVVITWKATDSSAPAAYPGKLFPGQNSNVTASVAVFRGGGFADLSRLTIYWYLDDNLIGGGVGKQTITFQAPGHSEIMSLRASLPDYPSGSLLNTAHIQIANPRAVIVAPYPLRVFAGSSVNIHAIPYFFQNSALQKLSYQWMVNGQAVTAAQDPENLTINLGASTVANFALNVDLIIQKTDDPLTNAHSNIALTTPSQ